MQSVAGQVQLHQEDCWRLLLPPLQVGSGSGSGRRGMKSALLHGSTKVVGIEANSWADQAAAKAMKDQLRYMKFAPDDLRVILAALQSWSTAADRAPGVDELIEAIQAHVVAAT